MGERFLACYSETAEAARGSDANCLVTFPQNGAIANVSYEGSSSPSDGDSSVRCMSVVGRFETNAAVCFGSIEWPILAKEAFRPLSGLTVSVRLGPSHYI